MCIEKSLLLNISSQKDNLEACFVLFQYIDLLWYQEYCLNFYFWDFKQTTKWVDYDNAVRKKN